MNKSEIHRFDQSARRSRALLHAGVAYFAGQVADDTTLDIEAQTRQALNKLDQMLEEVGTERSRLLSVQIWLKSIDDFESMNSVWDAWVVPEYRPTRCCCGNVALADPGLLVEIIAVAAC